MSSNRMLSDRRPHGCACGRAFGTLVGLWAHQEAKGHTGMIASDFGHDEAGHVEDWHAVGIALAAIAARVKAGEDINVDAEAATLRIPPARLLRALRAHGAIILEFA